MSTNGEGGFDTEAEYSFRIRGSASGEGMTAPPGVIHSGNHAPGPPYPCHVGVAKLRLNHTTPTPSACHQPGGRPRRSEPIGRNVKSRCSSCPRHWAHSFTSRIGYSELSFSLVHDGAGGCGPSMTTGFFSFDEPRPGRDLALGTPAVCLLSPVPRARSNAKLVDVVARNRLPGAVAGVVGVQPR